MIFSFWLFLLTLARSRFGGFVFCLATVVQVGNLAKHCRRVAVALLLGFVGQLPEGTRHLLFAVHCLLGLGDRPVQVEVKLFPVALVVNQALNQWAIDLGIVFGWRRRAGTCRGRNVGFHYRRLQTLRRR